jgi:type I restriction enzyme S subunit
MSFPRYPRYKDSGVEWLGEVPAHWEVKRFQRCVHVAEGQVDPEDARYSSMPLIAPNHVESGTGRLLGLESAGEQGAESGKYLCNAGDVVYSKIRPALRKVCIAPEPCLCSADMYPLRAHSGLTNPFLLWLMLSEQFSSLAVLESQRVAMPKINRESLKEIELVVPPLPEQTAIAGFLDRETAKIDALVTEQQRLIELLMEKRQAVVSHAVTKGLNPDAPMKDSGVEWLGEVPAHWVICLLNRAFRSVDYGISDSLAAEGPVAILRMGNIENGRVIMEDLKFTDAIDPNLLLVRGDLLYNRTNSLDLIGKVGIFLGGNETPVSFASYLVRLRVVEECLPEYFAYLLNSDGVLGTARANAFVAIGQCNLSPSRYGQIRVALPPRKEQASIVEYLDSETGKLDALTAEAQRAIELLQERRAALISAVVTGQIDVRGIVNRTAA